MAQDAKTRIEERTALAREHMREQGTFGRAISTIGLYVANSVDAVTGWIDNDKTVFMGSTASGLMRGALYGALIAIAAIAALHIVVLANVVFLGAAAIGAIGYGMYDGQKGLEHHLNSHGNPLPDLIAKQMGAVPEKTKDVNVDPTMPEKESNVLSFTAREDARRAEASNVQR